MYFSGSQIFFCYDKVCGNCGLTSIQNYCLTNFHNCDPYGWSWECSFSSSMCPSGNLVMNATQCALKNTYPNCPGTYVSTTGSITTGSITTGEDPKHLVPQSQNNSASVPYVIIFPVVFASLACCLIVFIVIVIYVRYNIQRRKLENTTQNAPYNNNIPMQGYVDHGQSFNSNVPQNQAPVGPVGTIQPQFTYPICLVGAMDGPQAEQELSLSNNGAYLLRWSERQNGYVLSYKTGVNLYTHVGPIQQTQHGFVLFNLNTNDYDTYPNLEVVVQTLCLHAMLTGPYK